MNPTQSVMQIVSAVLFFCNLLAFILIMFLFGFNSLDIFWGPVGHFAYIGSILIGDAILCAIIFILPQNWAQRD